MKRTPISISERLHKFLSENSSRKGETFEEIIWRLLGQKTLTKEQKQEVKADYEKDL